MPTVTLKRPHVTYTIPMRSHSYTFQVGVPVQVDTELADLCSTIKEIKGKKPSFQVTYDDPDGDIREVLGVQLEFESWPLSQP